LRDAIDTEYARMSAEEGINPIGNGANDFGSTVEKYIPVGSDFDKAEQVLSEAGFEIVSRGQDSVYPRWYRLLAKVRLYKQGFMNVTEAIVTIDPTSPADWSKVGKVEASFLLIYP
jgi:hypothetical protein